LSRTAGRLTFGNRKDGMATPVVTLADGEPESAAWLNLANGDEEAVTGFAPYSTDPFSADFGRAAFALGKLNGGDRGGLGADVSGDAGFLPKLKGGGGEGLDTGAGGGIRL